MVLKLGLHGVYLSAASQVVGVFERLVQPVAILLFHWGRQVVLFWGHRGVQRRIVVYVVQAQDRRGFRPEITLRFPPFTLAKRRLLHSFLSGSQKWIVSGSSTRSGTPRIRSVSLFERKWRNVSWNSLWLHWRNTTTSTLLNLVSWLSKLKIW